MPPASDRQRRRSARATRKRLGPRTAALSVLLAGMTVTVILVLGLRARDHDARRLGFERDARRLANSIQDHFQLPLELVRSVSTLFVASESVTRREFGLFTREILAMHPSIYAFEWMPLVPESRRATVEAAARAEGFEGFRFTQKDAAGEIVDVEISYPQDLRTQMLGFTGRLGGEE